MSSESQPTLFDKRKKPVRLPKKHVYLVASGDLRLSANQKCWPAQKEMEDALTRAVEAEGYSIVRAHEYCEDQQHGFLASQKQGMEVFARMDPKAPVIVAEAVWQYSHHVLSGLITHRGPILTVANWSGTWPGLVGMLNLNGSLTKAGVKYSTLWSEEFTDEYFTSRLHDWLRKGKCNHKTRHVVPLRKVRIGSKERRLGKELAKTLQTEK